MITTVAMPNETQDLFEEYEKAEEAMHKTMSIYDLRMHILSQGDSVDLLTRRPAQLKGRAAEKLPEKPEEQEAA